MSGEILMGIKLKTLLMVSPPKRRYKQCSGSLLKLEFRMVNLSEFINTTATT